MHDFVNENRDALLFLAAVFCAAWWVVRRNRMPSPDRVPMTVYCLHCNWEGRVTRGHMRCVQCHSRNLGVIAV